MIFLNSEELPRKFQVGDPSTYTVLNVLVCIWSEGCLPLVRTIHAAADKLLGVWPIEPIHPLYDKFSFLRILIIWFSSLHAFGVDLNSC